MLTISESLLRHLIRANEEELDRLQTLLRICGEEWPIEFDANDIPLHEIVRDQLQALTVAEPRGSLEVSRWKGVRFLIGSIPRYLQAHGKSLSPKEQEDLQALCVCERISE